MTLLCSRTHNFLIDSLFSGKPLLNFAFFCFSDVVLKVRVRDDKEVCLVSATTMFEDDFGCFEI